jgi:hypothetical protein
MINKYTGMLLIILASIQSYAQSINSSVLDAEDRYRQNSWVDSVYNQMTLEGKGRATYYCFYGLKTF